jgi:ATP-dependent Clp protease ATP-binding subunit ClpA
MATPEQQPTGDIFQPGGALKTDLFTPPAVSALHEAVRCARETQWDSLRSPHVFMGLLAVPDACVCDWGERLRADLPRLLGQFQELFFQEDGESEPVLHLHREFLSDNVIRLLREAFQRTVEHGRDQVTPTDLLISVVGGSNSIVAECFERIGIPAKTLTKLAVIAERHRDSTGSVGLED